MRKYVNYFLVALLVGVFRAFVLLNFWNWFVTAVFHVSEILFLQVLGLSLAIQLFTGDDDKTEENMRWGIAMRTLELCVPEAKVQDFKEAMKEMEKGIWREVNLIIFSQFFGYSVVLGFGFVIHLLMGVA